MNALINPDFIVIPQNGINLVSASDSSYLPSVDYLNAINGVGQEDLFYGYTKDNQATPPDAHQWLSNFLGIAKNNDKIIMVTDYCSTHDKMDDSYSKNHIKGYISFAATHRELDNIPAYPTPIYHENSDSVTKLQHAKNFLYLISPDSQYPSKKAFIEALKKTNYDLLIIDFFYDKEALTKNEIQALKQKANGKRRLVIAYMSIGEAEDYRYYWQDKWHVGSPAFIVEKNPQWQGNYTVKYWSKAWQRLIFGGKNSYLEKILNANFDGVYLDIVDAFERFE